MHCESNEGGRLLPRLYCWSSFSPSKECFEKMERAANGIGGIEAIKPSELEGTTFFFVLRRNVDPDETFEAWWKKFRKLASRVPEQQRHSLIGGLVRAQTGLKAMNSEEGIIYSVE